MIRLFAGYDQREAVGFSVFVMSVLRHASMPVAITPLQDADHADGSNAFTFARFRVPELCDYKGWAIFMDGSDQLVLGDLAELWRMRDDRYAVQVVKHNYKTRHPIKYRGTSMQCPNVDYPRKNWASVMLINCEAIEWSPAWMPTPTDHKSRRELLQFAGFDDNRIGSLPLEWNLLVDEGMVGGTPRCLHWTAGIPAFDNYRQAPFADLWLDLQSELVKPDV